MNPTQEFRRENSARTAIVSTAYGLLLLGAIVADSLLFQGKSVRDALGTISPWVYGTWATIVLLAAWSTWRWPSPEKGSRSEKLTLLRALKEGFYPTILVTLILSGDVEFTEFFTRAACIFPWILVANLLLDVLLVGWRKTERAVLESGPAVG